MFNYLSWNEINSKEHRAKVAVLLHNERINANLTLEALEEKTGKSKPTVQSWEKGWFYKTGKIFFHRSNACRFYPICMNALLNTSFVLSPKRQKPRQI